jgi:hypothetical protein
VEIVTEVYKESVLIPFTITYKIFSFDGKFELIFN